MEMYNGHAFCIVHHEGENGRWSVPQMDRSTSLNDHDYLATNVKVEVGIH